MTRFIASRAKEIVSPPRFHVATVSLPLKVVFKVHEQTLKGFPLILGESWEKFCGRTDDAHTHS